MPKYTLLTQAQRYQIFSLLKEVSYKRMSTMKFGFINPRSVLNRPPNKELKEIKM